MVFWLILVVLLIIAFPSLKGKLKSAIPWVLFVIFLIWAVGHDAEKQRADYPIHTQK